MNPLGLYNLKRQIRPVRRACKELIREWCGVLPTQSVCLRLPVVVPHEYDEEWARRNREDAQSLAAR